MNLRPSRSRLGRLLLCGVAAAVLAVPASVAGSRAAAVSGQAAQTDPPGTTYVYTGAFTAKISHRLFVDWADGDSDERTVDVTLQGTFPMVTMKGSDLSSVSLDSAVNVVTAQAEGVTWTNSGRHVKTCKGASGTVSGTPVLWPNPVWTLNDMSLFAFVRLPASCTDSEGPASIIAYEYEPLITSVQGGEAGAPTLNLAFRAGRGTAPLAGVEECPGYVEGQTPTCSYVIEGTLTLHLIRTIPPEAPQQDPEPDPQPDPKSQDARLTPGARKVSTPVRCPQRCAVTIRVTPLKGGPRITVPRRVSPRPGRTVNVKVAIPPAKRQLVRRVGGVRLKLTYRLADGTSYTETRTARR